MCELRAVAFSAEVAVTVSILSLSKVSGLVFGCLLLCACSGHPPPTDTNGKSHATGGSGGRGGAESLPTAPDSDSGVAGQIGIDVTGPVAPCKTTCSPGQCGPVSDGCGKFIDCGGCTAPEICGGAGIPSQCGSALSTCIPKTCAVLGATCGLQSDGCGGLVDCWSAAAKATGTTPVCEVAGALCVEGTCKSTAPDCTKLTCGDYAGAPDLCGPVSDGCGGTLDCGLTCGTDKVCGLVESGKCGAVICTPMNCEAGLAAKPAGYCGVVPDGCGGVIKDCGGGCAVLGESCGGGGVPDVCGKGAPICIPLTVAACGIACGQISDGCGGVIQCSACQLPATCGGGGIPGVCGTISCNPLTCASQGATCGSIADGCGKTVDCGTCTAPETCGGGGIPSKCGAAVCVPKTQAAVCVPGRCGVQSDGCSGTVTCGGCTLPNTCGGGGTPSVCGAPTCTKRTCASAGANCGPISDGCNGVISSCGTCTGSDVCGAVYPSVCGAGLDPNCTGLCAKVDRTCAAGSETRLTGKVYTPNGSLPLNKALVYVPNAVLPIIKTGPSCDRCEGEELGKPITAAITGADGAFVLRNVPAGVPFQLVTKIGKWRRVVTIPAVTACSNVNLTVDQARLPKSMTDADTANNVPFVNIPRIALVTGSCDAMECILRKFGVADTEFTLPSGSGRINIHYGGGGYITSSSSATRDTLFATGANGLANLYGYDISIFDCNCGPDHYPSYDPILHAWANAGGRFFTSHYGYAFLDTNDDFKNAAVWSGGYVSSSLALVDKTNPRGQALNTWLGGIGAWHPTYGDGFVNVGVADGYVQSTNAGSDRLLYTAPFTYNGTTTSMTASVQQFGFNTPFGADADHICGRVLYSAFHVTSDYASGAFPAYCTSTTFTAQEKTLMFGLFDLSACVAIGDPVPPTCTPVTCAQQHATCGQVADGCGALLSCGDCSAPLTCGGGGVPNQCGNSCTRTTCGAQGANCGVIADGCGGTLQCGTCTLPAVCGGGGTANVCGTPACAPRSCSDVGATCGAISDGCGGTISCGTCTPPATCGGGGIPNTCGIGTCAPVTCGASKCGFVGDGCGGTVACGTCLANQTCVKGVCSGGTCAPRSCQAASATCGFVGDGCGGVVGCGTCVPPLVCGGGGIPSQCGGTCSPRNCAAANAACGAIGDGCGGVKECGVCPPGQSCGGGGVPNQCAPGTCQPGTCAAVGAECGSIGDGCGAVLECGTCVAPESCGGAGVPNKCGTGGCLPLTCAQQSANCGPVADGCGGLLDCGPCPPGQTCGGDGIPSKCGGGTPI